jgi:alpha-tubulin suppressor-like RCC1 family protein
MGNNENGKLGIGENNEIETNVPCLVDGLVGHNIVQVACGQKHTLAVSDTKEVFGWGDGSSGATGNKDFSAYVPKNIELFQKEGIKIERVSCGSHHSAFVSSNFTYSKF